MALRLTLAAGIAALAVATAASAQPYPGPQPYVEPQPYSAPQPYAEPYVPGDPGSATGSVAPARPHLSETLGPDDEVVVREYVIRRRPQIVEIEPEARLRPGSYVPGYVELDPMSDVSDPRLRRYASFVSPDNKVVVVDPITRTVVRILDR